MCPDVDEIELQGNPWMHSSRPGSGLVMVINGCNTAVTKGDKELIAQGFTKYSYAQDEVCEDDATIKDELWRLVVHSKIMSQDVNNLPTYESSGSALKTYFMSKDEAGLSNGSVQRTMHLVSKHEIFYNNSPLQHAPIVKWFYTVTEPDVIDYDFESANSAYYQNTNGIISANPSYGYLAYGMF